MSDPTCGRKIGLLHVSEKCFHIICIISIRSYVAATINKWIILHNYSVDLPFFCTTVFPTFLSFFFIEAEDKRLMYSVTIALPLSQNDESLVISFKVYCTYPTGLILCCCFFPFLAAFKPTGTFSVRRYLIYVRLKATENIYITQPINV